ncbi:hypothetical protein Hanom_Chr05g00426151 [Helianthus anomalus]
MWQLVEDALVATGISMLWASDNPPEAPTYGYDGRECVTTLIEYNLINILDDTVEGEMNVKVFPDNELPWLDQIRDFFHHATEERLARFANTRTSVHPSPL